MNTFIKILIGAGVIGGGVYLLTKAKGPKIIIEKVDYIGKQVTFTMQAGGRKFTGSKNFTDKTTSSETYEKYQFIASAEGNGFVLMITKKDPYTRRVALTTIDLDKQIINQDLNQGIIAT